jgi:hypothetical protein
VFPGRPQPGRNPILRRELPSIYVSGIRGKSKPPPRLKNHGGGWELPESSGQWPVPSTQYLVPSAWKMRGRHQTKSSGEVAGYWVLATECLRFAFRRHGFENFLFTGGRRHERQVNLDHEPAFGPVRSCDAPAVETHRAFGDGQT